MYTSMLSVPGISDGFMANSKYWPRHGSPIRENIGLVYWLFFPAEKPPPHRHQVLASNPQPQLLGPVVLRPGVVEHGADNGYEGNAFNTRITVSQRPPLAVSAYRNQFLRSLHHLWPAGETAEEISE